jgi:CRP/FNR family transcriptional regulator
VNPAIEQALNASCWAKCPRPQVEAMFAEGFLAEASAGLIFSKEQGEGRVALVLSGLFRMFARAKNGRQMTVAYAREGDMIGLIAALAGPCTNGMQALTTGTLWVMSADNLKRHAFAHPELASALCAATARYNHDMLEEFADTAFGTVRQRVARHLLDLVVEGTDDGPLLAPISQQELANAVGTVREVVSRVLTSFKSEGLVRATPSGLEVLDATQLYEQSQVSD